MGKVTFCVALTDALRQQAGSTGCACCRGKLLPLTVCALRMTDDITVQLRLCDDCAQLVAEAPHQARLRLAKGAP